MRKGSRKSKKQLSDENDISDGCVWLGCLSDLAGCQKGGCEILTRPEPTKTEIANYKKRKANEMAKIEYDKGVYLKASDCDEGPLVVTIKKIELESITNPKTKETIEKYVVYFKEEDQGLVLNKTNGRKITALAGGQDETDWVGTKIELYKTEVQFGDEMVDAIRVREPGSVPF